MKGTETMSEPTDTAPGLLLSDDLIFASRITGTARAMGLEVRQVRALDQLPESMSRWQARCVIVDLAFPGLDLPDLMHRLGETGAAPRVVAYGSHVDAAALRAAREAGCAPVLPRSKFVEDLAHELPGWLAG
jgi:DNA-binding NarL/FixJ family response regulator